MPRVLVKLRGIFVEMRRILIKTPRMSVRMPRVLIKLRGVLVEKPLLLVKFPRWSMELRAYGSVG
jgi:hypothetical protein